MGRFMLIHSLPFFLGGGFLDENGVQQTPGSPVRAIAYLPEHE